MTADNPTPDVNLPGTQPASGSSGNTPGVYVRQNHNPNDLDMLWSGSRQFQKEDRSPIIFTAAGFVLGVVITSAVFFLFTQEPNVSIGNDPAIETASDTELLKQADQPVANEPAASTSDAPSESAASMIERITGSPSSAPTATPNKQTQSSSTKAKTTRQTHTVASGDTLGRIAYKYYGQSGPLIIRKLVAVNGLANPDDLSIGQELVIPAE